MNASRWPLGYTPAASVGQNPPTIRLRGASAP